MITPEYKNIAQWAMDFALKNGCSSARVSVIVATNNSFEYRNNQLDKLSQSSENKLYIELFTNGRYGTLSTNRLEKSELETFIKEGIASTRLLEEDLCRKLPDQSRYYKSDKKKDLDLFDKDYFSYKTEEKLDLIKNTVNEVLGKDDRIISVSSFYDDGCGAEYMISSNGFENEEIDTAYSLGAEVAIKTDGDARPDAYWVESNPYWSDLKKTDIATKTLKRALDKLGQAKIKSGIYNMLLDNTVSSRLISPLISAMYGSAIQQKNSFLLDRLSTKITSSLLTITDKPFLKRTFGARLYDYEGVATKERTIIDKGVLNTYFIDTYNASKLKVQPTIASPSVLTLEKGENNLNQLIALMSNGIWVTGFNGGNTNTTTGDFSFGIEGFLVENGVVAKPVGEMNITGNILDLWIDLVEVGNDPLSLNSSRQIPSLLFQNVSFSGS